MICWLIVLVLLFSIMWVIRIVVFVMNSICRYCINVIR